MMHRVETAAGTASPYGFIGPVSGFTEADVSLIINQAENAIIESRGTALSEDDTTLLVYKSAIDTLSSLQEVNPAYPVENVISTIFQSIYSSVLDRDPDIIAIRADDSRGSFLPRAAANIPSLDYSDLLKSSQELLDVLGKEKTESLSIAHKAEPLVLLADIYASQSKYDVHKSDEEERAVLAAKLSILNAVKLQNEQPLIYTDEVLMEKKIKGFIIADLETSNADAKTLNSSLIFYKSAADKIDTFDLGDLGPVIEHMNKMIETTLIVLSQVDIAGLYDLDYSYYCSSITSGMLEVAHGTMLSIRDEAVAYLPKNLAIIYDDYDAIEGIDALPLFISGLIAGYKDYYISHSDNTESENIISFQNAIQFCTQEITTKFIEEEGSFGPWPKASNFLMLLNSGLGSDFNDIDFTIELDTALGPKSTDDFEDSYPNLTLVFN